MNNTPIVKGIAIDKLKLSTIDKPNVTSFFDDFKRDKCARTSKLNANGYKRVETYKYQSHSISFCETYGSRYVISMNPSKVGSFSKTIDIINQTDVKNIVIGDIHRAIDFEYQSVDAFIQLVDINFKHIVNEFLGTGLTTKNDKFYYKKGNRSGVHDGMYYGAINNNVVIYDKSKEQLVRKGMYDHSGIPDNHIIRLEHRQKYTGRIIDRTFHISKIEKKLRNNFLDTSFLKSIKLRTFDYNELCIQNKADLIKFVRLQTKIEDLGLKLAKQQLSQTNNFNRDYKKFITEHEPINLEKPYLDGIRKFLTT